MATHDYIISNASGAAVRADLNNALAAIATNNSSATAPTTTYAYQWWADTGSSPTVMKLRNAANSAWITLFQLDGEWSNIAFENGTAAAPSIYFKDSGTDTGIYSPGTDQVAITTGGTGRLFVDSSGRVGLGTSSPSGTLEVGAVSGAVTAGDLTVTTGSTTATVTIGRLSSTGNDNTIFNIRNRAGTSTLYMNSGDGRLGIGTTAPNRKLEVSDASADNLIRVNTTGATKSGIEFASGGTVYSQLYFNNVAPYDLSILQQYTTGSLILGTNNTERARIDSSGRLLVGTSTSNSTFDSAVQIAGGSSLGTQLISRFNNNGGGPVLYLAKSRSGTVGTNTIVQSGDELGTIDFRGANGSAYDSGATIQAFVDGTPGSSSDMPGRLVFSTTRDNAASPTESMRIKNNGETWILPTLYGLEVSTATGAGTTYTLYEGLHSGGSVGAGTLSYRVFSNGNVQNTNGSFTAISDVRLKENIADANSQWNDLKAIQIRNWNFKEETGYETHRQIGPIAQELEQVCPGLVFETPERDEDGNETGEVTKGVNQSVLYMKAVKALQEAMERIEVLEQRLTDAGIA
jgi:hypothetical protein